jgi:hypothetical protein
MAHTTVWFYSYGTHCLILLIWRTLSDSTHMAHTVWFYSYGTHCLILLIWHTLSDSTHMAHTIWFYSYGTHCLILLIWHTLSDSTQYGTHCLILLICYVCTLKQNNYSPTWLVSIWDRTYSWIVSIPCSLPASCTQGWWQLTTQSVQGGGGLYYERICFGYKIGWYLFGSSTKWLAKLAAA